ncbi:uroplakin-3b-like [Spea bombifrons]|uniref:uroplakin-3b-like n=1 Tax=Spea bombifrons TaxID=233779 RepID=UPI002349DEF4|nr:uroplakin-3b-like [Spea bombifrons]
MGLCGNVWLFLGTLALTFADVPYYVPQITTKPLLGKLTLSGFVLEQPQCIFNQYSGNDIWLVVALNSVVPKLNYTHLSTPSPYSRFETNKFYHILKTLGSEYPCSDTSVKTAAMLEVGSASSCTNVTFCNGALSKTGPYRVKFVVLSMNGTVMINETRWSDLISLKTGQNPSQIEPWPARRSAGMIIITVILSVLLAVLLACLIAALITRSKDVCWCKEINNEAFVNMEVIDNYNTHPIYVSHSQHKLTK